ncbi:MAG: flavin reductase family protein [Syntrophobacter sp.]
MSKIKIGPQTLVYPMPAFLIGAEVDGKANFMTAAWAGIANSTPPSITVSFQHHRLTLKGIRENGVFSVNVPHAGQVKETDFCGIFSGLKEDKAAVCGFSVFHGDVTKAPLIEQCPVNLECRVLHMLNLGSHIMVVGRIEEVHVSAECMTDGEPDPAKIDPLMYISGGNKSYHKLGEFIGPAFKIGLELKGGKK